jgi:hypothetical protein
MIRSPKLRVSARRIGLWVTTGVIWALCVPFNAAAQDLVNGPGRYQFTNLGSGSTRRWISGRWEFGKRPWRKVLDLNRNDQTSVTPLAFAFASVS